MLTAMIATCLLTATPPALPTGWTWDVEPDDIAPNGVDFISLGQTGTIVANWSDDHFTARFIESRPVEMDEGTWNGRGRQYQLVVVPIEGKMEYHRPNSNMGNRLQNVHQWIGRFADPKNLAQLGMVRLDEDGVQLISREAIEEARSKDLDVLPLAVMGRKFDFNLTTMDGQRISTDEYQGKIVLIDNWATWCGPCMQKMPRLRELNEKWKTDGLQVVGIDWDRDVAKGEQAIAREQMTWPQVNPHVSSGGDEDLWDRASGITVLPYLVLLDETGVVMTAGRPEDVMETMNEVMLGTLPRRLPGWTPEQVGAMTTQEIRINLVTISQARKAARDHAEMSAYLSEQFNLLMTQLKAVARAETPGP